MAGRAFTPAGLPEGRVPDYGNKVDTTVYWLLFYIWSQKSLRGYNFRFYGRKNGKEKV